MWWLFCHLRFVLFASTMEFVAANDQCRTEINIQGMALESHVFKRWSLTAPHLCDVKCGQEITCQSYNYNRKYQICELNNRTKEARPENFLLAPAWIYIRRLNGRAPLGSIPELPALSCHEIKASEGKYTISGKYWMDPTRKGKAKLIYCDMVNEDMDECKFNISDCDVNANCTNTYGSYKCTCKMGYIGDGRSCSDIDECKGNHPCHVNATCTNTKGSYACTCHPGYTGNGGDCKDIDECKGNHSCHVNAACMYTLVSHVWQCHAGYTGNGANRTDIDGCARNLSCRVNANCTNTIGSHVCTYHTGYTGDGQTCSERNRTMLFPDYFFFVEKRLVLHEIETKYVKDLYHCELFCYMNDNCVSVNFKKEPETGGIAYICELNNATHLEYDTDLITDADFYYRGSKNACGKNPPCQNNATCQSGFTIKGYRCSCPPGFEGEHCEKDIDECQKNTHDCHLNATCQNINGSFVCTCLLGFNGDGRNCTADPCYNYRNLSDADRKSTYITPLGGVKCDDEFSSITFGKWHRFVGDAGTKMPTQCVPDNRCGAVFSGWLKGGHPTLADGEVLSEVCFTRGGDCCKKSNNIKVKDCGSYFIYQLKKLPTCPLRYCGTD